MDPDQEDHGRRRVRVGSSLAALVLVAACSSDASYRSSRLPRDIAGVREAFTYLEEQMRVRPRECALRSVAVTTRWPQALTTAEIVVALDACRDARSYLATFDNDRRQLAIVATPAGAQQDAAAYLRIDEIAVDIDRALVIAGTAAGEDMLARMKNETQVSLYLFRRDNLPVWEVRYDAWRDRRPLRYLVVTIDARTGEMLRTSG